MSVSVGPNFLEDKVVFKLDVASSKGYNSSENLFTYSEQFDNAIWSKGNSSITPNAAIAPNGTLTADAIVEDSATAQHLAYQSLGTTVVGAVYTLSVYAKRSSAGRTFVMTSFGEPYIVFDLSTGTKTQGSVPTTIDPVGNGWYRISVTFTKSNTTNNYYYGLWNGTNNYLGDGVSNVYVWGAQVERGHVATPYVQTVATNIASRTTTITDLKGAYNGTIVGGNTYFTAANGGSVYSMAQPTTDYISLYGIPATVWTGGDWTFSTWVKFNTVNRTTINDNCIIGHGSAAASQGLHIGERAGTAFFGFYSNDAGSATAISANTWYNLVFVWNKATLQKTFYTNNVASGPFTASAAYAGTGTNTELMRYPWSNTSNGFDGFLGHTTLHSVALTAKQVNDNFQALRGRYGI